MTMHPVIKIDLRERRSGLPALLENNGLPLEYLALKAGDYIIGERFIIERKTAFDFVESLNDGRLFEQCRKMHQSHLFPLLLLEGNPYNTDHNTHRRAIKVAMIAITAGWQIPIIYSKDTNDSCNILVQLIDQQIKRTRFVIANTSKRHPSSHPAVQFLGGIPGLGPIRAEHLLRTAGSIRNVLNMEEKELANSKGLGPTTAKKIAEFLDQPFSETPGC